MLYSELLDDLLWLIRKGIRTYKRKYDREHEPLLCWMLRCFGVRYGLFEAGILYPEDRVFVWNREESRIVST